jgi:hypothetical protein
MRAFGDVGNVCVVYVSLMCASACLTFFLEIYILVRKKERLEILFVERIRKKF